MNTLAKFLKARRIIAGLTQAELAVALGYDNGQFISNIERGICSLPEGKIKDFSEVTTTPVPEILRQYVKQYKTNLYLEVHGGKK